MERHFFSSRGGRNAKPGKKIVGLAECAGRLGRIKEGEDRRSDSQNLGFGRLALEGLGRTWNREFSTPSRDGRRIASRIPLGLGLAFGVSASLFLVGLVGQAEFGRLPPKINQNLKVMKTNSKRNQKTPMGLWIPRAACGHTAALGGGGQVAFRKRKTICR